MDILNHLKNTAGGCFFASNFGGSFMRLNFNESSVSIKKMFCSYREDEVYTYICDISGELKLIKDDSYGVVYSIKKENDRYVMYNNDTEFPVSCALVGNFEIKMVV